MVFSVHLKTTFFLQNNTKSIDNSICQTLAAIFELVSSLIKQKNPTKLCIVKKYIAHEQTYGNNIIYHFFFT